MNIEFRLQANGIGDAICGVYTACGLANRGHIVTFHAKHAEYLKWLKNINLTIVPDKGADVINANANYEEQLEASRTGKCESRSLWYMQNIQAVHTKIKGEVQPVRPDTVMKANKPGDLPNDYIILAPFSAYQDRQWDIQHWRMLAKLLMNEGQNVVAIGAARDGDKLKDAFTKTGVRYFWGQTPEWLVGAIQNANVTIGNDSGPAHIAGLYGSNAIALCGQISGHFVYRHSPTVFPVQPPENATCSPCHWKHHAGYSDMCSAGCSALQLISPFQIADIALRTESDVL